MPRGSEPGERRGGRQRGTPNKKTLLKNALFVAAAAEPDRAPLDFMLALLRDPQVPLDLRLDLAVAAAPYLHVRPQAPSWLRSDPLHPTPITRSSRESAPPEMAAQATAAQRAGETAGGETGVGQTAAGDNRRGDNPSGGNIKAASEQAGANGGASSAVGGNGVGNGLRSNGAGGNGHGSSGYGGNGYGGNGHGGNGHGGYGHGGNGAGNGHGGNRVHSGIGGYGGDHGAELSPLQFLFGVMRDADATPRQRLRAARAAARYTHVPAMPDTRLAVDQYGFAIDRTLADAIKDDWFELKKINAPSSRMAQSHSALLARQAERDKFLECPPGYSPECDLERRDELIQKRQRSRAQETELAFVIARITAYEAAFNRSPEGQARRRIADLEYRRKAANNERNRRAGLTKAEGKELDDLRKRYPPKAPPQPPGRPIWEPMPIMKLIKFRGGLRGQPAAAVVDPDAEMEELEPTFEEKRKAFMEQITQSSVREKEEIARRLAAGDPDPWDGEAPGHRIYVLEWRRLDKVLTAAEEDELQKIARLYPEEVEKIGKTVARRRADGWGRPYPEP